MDDAEQRIEELEIKAAESALIANLATDRKARVNNSRIADELSELVDELRKGRQCEQPVTPGSVQAP
jgi:uncharacterized coiled-coil protein SlyX